MRNSHLLAASLALLTSGFLGCGGNQAKFPDVSDDIRKSLDSAGLNDVKVTQDRKLGVVTLSGDVPTRDDKDRAEVITKSRAAGQVVSDEIGVRPAGNETDARTVSSDLDKAIDKNLDAALVQRKLKDGVRYDVSNGVVTLKGNVNSQARRQQIQKVASSVPNVKQVVNELQVKEQRATSSY
jgi:hyperosmotically inducible periplasmic protein